MFEKMIESAKSRQRGRAGRFFFLTGLVYAMLLVVVGVWTIMGFSPGLAEGYAMLARLIPPVPYSAPALPEPKLRAVKQEAKPVIYAPPDGTERIRRADEIPDIPVSYRREPLVPGAPQGNNANLGSFISGKPRPSDEEPPLPPPTPKPIATPAPTPTPPQGPVRISSSILQGKALRKVQPPYPAIAKAAGAQGAVQVQISIAEDGRVVEAYVLSGHPLLRDASLQAARQWLFSPTVLNGVPVRVQGILTFNFTLH